MNIEFKGTPGPWTGMKLTECLPLAHCDQVGLSIGFVNSSSEKRMEEGKANARLIAAAPDLLSCLRHMVACHYPDANGQIGAKEECWDSIQAAQVAISKALEEQP